MPDPAARIRLTAVSCTSPSFCMAAGSWTSRNLAVAARGLVWDGRTWRPVAMPAAFGAGVASVSCVTARFCVAVGNAAAQWNGRSWRLLPPLRYGLGLASVSCVSVSFCMAVGTQGYHSQTIVLSRALVWNGVTWRRTHPPGTGGSAALTGVSCSGAARCLAIGWQGSCNQPPQPLDQHCYVSLRWDGSTWTKLRSSPAAPLVTNLACWAAAGCVAAGDCNLPGNCRGTTTAAWNGLAWQQHRAPAPGRHGSFLDGVACWRRSECFAVGGEVNDARALPSASAKPDRSRTGDPHPARVAAAVLTLIEQWNGTSWHALRTPSP